jgi:hypothetical protein
MELGLKVEKPDMGLYKLIKVIYDDIEKELELRTPFDPNVALGNLNQSQYQLRRALIESVEYGTDIFLSEGTITRQVTQQGPQQKTLIQELINLALMTKTIITTGFGTNASIFDTTGLENPYYETTSQGDSLIEQMKNNTIIVSEVEFIEEDQDLEVPAK